MRVSLPKLALGILGCSNINVVSGTILANYLNTRTNVDHIADLVKDMRDMSENCDNNNQVEAETIYIFGKNSPYLDVPGHRSFQKFSQEGPSHIDPTFAFQMYGMTGGNLTKMDDVSISQFADAEVMEAFNNNDCALAVDYSAILSVWFKIASDLWKVISECDANAAIEDAPPLAYSHKADEFIAMYIGSLQTGTDTTDGYSLYSIAQIAAASFGEDGIAFTNRLILEKYEELTETLNNVNACTPGSITVQRLWDQANKIKSAMLVPIVQLLIDSIYKEEQNLVKLYGMVIVNQLSQCRHSTYTYLDRVLLQENVDQRKLGSIFEALSSSFDCLDISCDDFGIYENDSSIQCDHTSFSTKMANYLPMYDVSGPAKFDVDIQQLDILMAFDKAESWEMARLTYSYGKGWRFDSDDGDDDDDDDSLYNNDDDGESSDLDELMSLQSLAKYALASGNGISNLYTIWFLDQNELDTVIMEAFSGEGKWGVQSRSKRASLISTTIQTSVMYLTIAATMEQAITECRSNEASKMIQNSAWDAAAAFIIGSFEGASRGGSDDLEDGKSFWNLGNRVSSEFGRINSEGFAIHNEQILNLLLAGKGMIESRACESLEMIITKIEHFLLIPIMQSVIKYAIINELKPSFDGDNNIVIGEAFANALLPMVDMHNADAAQIIKRNMVVERMGDMVPDGPQVIADAINSVVRDFGVECEYIGRSNGVDTCLNYVPMIQTERSAAAFFHMMVPSSLLVLSSLFLL